MNRRAVAITLVILLLAAVSSWLSEESRREARRAEAEGERAPDYFMEGVVATEMGADGRPRQRLEATRLNHFPRDGRSELAAPHLVVYQDESPPWHLFAKRGEVRAGGAEIFLEGGVRLTRAAPEEVEIRSATLRLHPDRRHAETADPIVVVSGADRLEAVGMEASLQDERVTLKSQVRGIHAP